MTIKAINCTPDEWEEMVESKEESADVAAYEAFCNTIVDAINNGFSSAWVIDNHQHFIGAQQDFAQEGFSISHNRIVADGLLLINISKAK